MIMERRGEKLLFGWTLGIQQLLLCFSSTRHRSQQFLSAVSARGPPSAKWRLPSSSSLRAEFVAISTSGCALPGTHTQPACTAPVSQPWLVPTRSTLKTKGADFLESRENSVKDHHAQSGGVSSKPILYLGNPSTPLSKKIRPMRTERQLSHHSVRSCFL